MNSIEVTFATIPLSRLVPNKFNARRIEENMTPQRRARFEELVDSIHSKGILEPLLVRPIDGELYEVIAGERRYRAAVRVSQEDEIIDGSYLLPCMIRDVDEAEAFDIMVIENLQREDLTPFELAHTFRLYLERHGNTADAASDLSLRTGIPVHAIRRQVRLLELPAEILTAWKNGIITASHVELFTRVGDHDQALELLATCQRSKLSTRELAERIGTVTPDLERGFFDKTECQLCHFNTSIQSGLFADIAPGGKCGNPACFEQKQSSFLTDNWSKSKPAVNFGTQGFRFGHRLNQEHREPSHGQETADRCRACEAFISVLRLTGAVVSGYERTCTGPSACFDELYTIAPPASPIVEQDIKGEQDPAPEQTEGADTSAAPPKTPAPPAKEPKTASKPAATEETGPVFNLQRGDKYREIFLRDRIRDVIKALPADGPQNIRIILTALTATSAAVKQQMAAGLGLDVGADTVRFADKIFLIPAEDLPGELQNAAIAYLTDQLSGQMPVRRFISEQLGIDMARDWEITPAYLDALNRSEIVRVCEEPGIELWRDEKAAEYRSSKYKGKALRALKKEELIDIIISSGADLKGLVPAEILGVKKG